MSDFPIRCFTCNKVIGRYYLKYEKALNTTILDGTETVKQVLDRLGISRTCCRTIFMTYINICDNLNMEDMTINSLEDID